jgi:thioredoxin 1
MLIKLSADNYDSTVEKGVVIVDFVADWCIPCKMMEPALAKASKEFVGKVKFASLDVGQYQEVAVKQKVSSVPTLILYRDGVVQRRLVGNQNFLALKKAITEVLESNG